MLPGHGSQGCLDVVVVGRHPQQDKGLELEPGDPFAVVQDVSSLHGVPAPVTDPAPEELLGPAVLVLHVGSNEPTPVTVEKLPAGLDHLAKPGKGDRPLPSPAGRRADRLSARDLWLYRGGLVVEGYITPRFGELA